MNQKNEDFLVKQLTLTGFGFATEELKKRLKEGLPSFQITHKPEYGNAQAIMHFKKSSTTDNYFFNKYDLHLKNDKGEHQVKQTFYINMIKKPQPGDGENTQQVQNRGVTYSLKEAFNLLIGRSVRKTFENDQGKKYTAWVDLDFKNVDKHGNFLFKKNILYDLEIALTKFPIKELENPAFKERLKDSLERGNLQKVTFQINGEEKPMYIRPSVNSGFRGKENSTLSIFDATLQKVPSQPLQIKTQQQQNSPEAKILVEAKKPEVKQGKTRKAKDTQATNQKRSKNRKQS